MTSEAIEAAFAQTCVVVPAYNEGPSIATVVADINGLMPGSTVVVVNDGSSDDTATRAHEAGAVVLTLSVNLGIGGAVQTGYKYALANGYAYAVQVDGDGQHDLRGLAYPAAQVGDCVLYDVREQNPNLSASVAAPT